MIIPQNFLDLPWVNAAFYDKTECHQVPNPILMKQVHSADVLVVDAMPQEPPHLDALVTKKTGLNLTVKTADCAPILLADTTSQIVAAVHAGWKGALQGVIETTILKMLSLGAHIDTIRAAVGPHLQKQSFQISNDMAVLFPVTEREQFITENENGLYFDFDAYVIHRLQRAGIQNIDSCKIDTYTSQNYNSYRRDPESHARQYSSIMIKEK